MMYCKQIYIFSTLFAVLASMTFSSHASEGEWAGSISVNSRIFAEHGEMTEQQKHSTNFSLNLSYYQDFQQGDARLVFDGFARVDQHDSSANLLDVKELYWWQYANGFEISAGFKQVFWGVTETVHLVDVINQTDTIGNLNGEQKLGQPMVNVLMERDWGTLQVFALLGFQERQFSSTRSRLTSPIPVEESLANYQSTANQKRIDWALRYSHVVSEWDIGISYFNGIDRNPILMPKLTDQSSLSLAPYYQTIDQLGIDVQGTFAAWLLKFETIVGKVVEGSGYFASVTGLEYSFYSIAESAIDIGLIIEHQFDDRENKLNNNDLAIGARVAFNNSQSSELLVALTQDLDNQSQFFTIEASHRINDLWFIETQAAIFSNNANHDASAIFANEDHIRIELKRFF